MKNTLVLPINDSLWQIIPANYELYQTVCETLTKNKYDYAVLKNSVFVDLKGIEILYVAGFQWVRDMKA